MKTKILTTALFAAGAAAFCVAATSLVVVAPGELVMVRRLGRVIEPPWGPGLHWRLPLGIDRIDRVRSDAVRQLTIGSAGPPGADDEPSAGEVMTGDLNMLMVQATVQYRISQPMYYLLHVERVESLLGKATAAAVARALSARGVDAVLRTDRQAIARAAEVDLAALASKYRLGVAILGLSLTDARPPAEVAADFAAAQSAESERDRRINDAESYEETTAIAAKSAADAKLESARAVADRRAVTSRAEADSFTLLAAEAERSRALTMRRLYIESVQALLDGVKRKIVVPAGGELDLTVLGINDAPALVPSDSAAPPRAKK